MRHKIIALALCVGLCSSIATANEIYIALADGSASTMLENGSGTLNVYFSDDMDVDTGAFLDITSSNPSAVMFTAANVINPDINVGGSPFFMRWQSVNGGSQTVSPGLIDELQGFKVNTGTGILTSQTTGNTFEDQGHDATLGAFLFATIDFTSTANTLDDVIISISTGDGLVVNAGVELTPTYTPFTFTAVPEPTSAALLAIGMVGMVARRRR